MKEQNIFKELRVDHEKQRELFKELQSTSGDSTTRRELFQELKNNLEEHAKYEEKYFYSPLMKKDITIEASRHAVHEHYKIDSKIEELQEVEYSSPQWLKKLGELQELVVHHLKEEERGIFQLAGKALTESQKRKLAVDYKNEMNS